jgi:nitrile hydratase
MNGIHDLGGMHGFGPVEAEPDEPVFHEAWEARTFAIMNLIGAVGLYKTDEVRHAIEHMDPACYLSTTYYEHWIHALENVLASKGVTATGGTAVPLQPALPKGKVASAIAAGLSCRMEPAAPPRFRIGDPVVAKNINPAGHTRLPRYVRGKRGIISADRGGFVFPDTRAHGEDDKPQHVYNISFRARDLWGPEAPAQETICIDLWDDYLDAA